MGGTMSGAMGSAMSHVVARRYLLKPRSAKAKGTRLEKWVSTELNRIGIKSRRQPGSGIYADFKHDNWAHIPNVGDVIIECKARREGHKTLEKWLGSAELLIIKKDHGSPNVYMPWTTFAQIIGALVEQTESESVRDDESNS